MSGLTLAKVLEKFDIDHVVLEAHATTAPQLGASIGLLPSGLQILDQLGCYESIRERVGTDCYYQTTTRRFDGQFRSVKKDFTFSEELEQKYDIAQFPLSLTSTPCLESQLEGGKKLIAILGLGILSCSSIDRCYSRHSSTVSNPKKKSLRASALLAWTLSRAASACVPKTALSTPETLSWAPTEFTAPSGRRCGAMPARQDRSSLT